MINTKKTYIWRPLLAAFFITLSPLHLFAHTPEARSGGKAGALGKHPTLTRAWIPYNSRIQAQNNAGNGKQYIAVPSRAELAQLPPASGDQEWACLTEALYFEARGETIPGIFAVAEVIVNRRDHKKFPNTICKVINQGAKSGKKSCQFSYKCDGLPEHFSEDKAYELVGKIAKIVLEERAPLLTLGATYYHAAFVSPYWAESFAKTATIGRHLFYRG